MPKFKLDGLVPYLRKEYGEGLRWVPNYNSETYSYNVHHVRDDARKELQGNQPDYVIHRSLAEYNKRHTEEVYFHLGESNYLVADYERGTAFHGFADDVRGVTTTLEPDIQIRLPTLDETCRGKVAST